MRLHRGKIILTIATLCVIAGCGVKGDPLPPKDSSAAQNPTGEAPVPSGTFTYPSGGGYESVKKKSATPTAPQGK
jgi:predicted small lipoprotein YifL